MNSTYTIFAVDDDKTSRLLIESMLGDRYVVETFDCAESCLSRLNEKWPDLFLLDVELPGMNGLDLCREIKGVPEALNIPVVFLSVRSDPEDVMASYEAGGQDYIFKPFDVISLHHKIENLHRIEEDKNSLAVQVQASDEVASIVMANLDEYAVLIKFLRTLNECTTTAEVVEAVLHVLKVSHLEGAVQIRMRNGDKTFSQSGENWPLEVAVINHVRTMDRIFEFRKRAAYNFDHVTVLVTNMPVEDPDLCGRIRDNLCIAAESVEAKLVALQSFEDNGKIRNEIHGLMQNTAQTIQAFSQRYEQAYAKGTIYTAHFLDDLLGSFAHLGMTEQQEEEILQLVKTRTSGLIEIYDVVDETKNTLAKLITKLELILTETQQLHAKD